MSQDGVLSSNKSQHLTSHDLILSTGNKLYNTFMIVIHYC